MIKAHVIPEPLLEFRYKQCVADPRDGLSMFGPYDQDLPSHPASIVYGVIGSHEVLSHMHTWSQKLIQPQLTDPFQHDTRNWPHYPGFEAAFGCKWNYEPAWTHEIDKDQVIQASVNRDPHQRAARVVDFYMRGIESSCKRDEDLRLIICIVPDEVYKNCRPESVIAAGEGYKPSKKERQERSMTGDLFDAYDPDDYSRSPDFRRQLKARVMAHGVPIQIILESTFFTWGGEASGMAKVSPHSSVAWPLSTALYYKAGGKPWRLATARDGVCYIGFAFKRNDEGDSDRKTACCAAQMFLDTGDGIVFKGEFGPWYSPDRKDFHLHKDAAKNLLAGVLKTYSELGGKPLKEIFLHSRSWINDEEFTGYQEACPSGVKLAGIRVRLDKKAPLLYRPGAMPVLRGTMLKFTDRVAYLWTSGFKPRLETYDGFDVPLPLRIDVQHGEGDIDQIAHDIMGLTKLNYNACRLGGAPPVTIKFSDQVGEILVNNPTVKGVKPQFKYYI